MISVNNCLDMDYVTFLWDHNNNQCNSAVWQVALATLYYASIVITERQSSCNTRFYSLAQW